MANISHFTQTVNGVSTTYDIHDANAVDLSSNQTVGGIKTFSNAPVVGAINLDGKTIDTDANGNMTYDNHIIDTIEERGIEGQGEGYIRYSNGLQICWGYIGPGMTVTKNFPKSFSHTPYILVSGDAPDSSMIVNTQRTSQAVTTYCNREYYGSCYIAIGRWK